MLEQNFDDINAETIQALINADAQETVRLEFKRETYGKTPDDKKEFLKDITAFANTFGGYLFIGIDEKDGRASGIIPLSSNTIDKEIRRLESIKRTGIEPEVAGLRMKPVEVSGGSVIVIHIPQGSNPPYRVIFRNSNRYYGRNSAEAYELRLDELRVLFSQRRRVEEQAAAFVRERFLRIHAGDGIKPLQLSNGVLVMHLVPLLDFADRRRRIGLSKLREHSEHFPSISQNPPAPRANLEGLCVSHSQDSYTQIFRDGSVESVSAALFRQDPDGIQILPPKLWCKQLTEILKKYMKGLQKLGAQPPIMLQISAFGICGLKMGTSQISFQVHAAYERETLHLPSAIIEEYRDDYNSTIAEQMHFLWNVFGEDRCPLFNEGDKLVDT